MPDFKLPFPSFMPYAASWSFWSFVLANPQSPMGSYSAEIIFGWPSVWVWRGTPPPSLPNTPPVIAAPTPLTNSALVGISCGERGVWQCTNLDVVQGGQSAGLLLDSGASAGLGTTSVEVTPNGAILKGLGIQLDLPKGTVPTVTCLPIQLSMTPEGNGEILGSAEGATGAWQFRTAWALWVAQGPVLITDAVSDYSLSKNPIFTTSPFPH